MKFDNEITLEVTSDFNTLNKSLENNGFKQSHSFDLNDIYMIDKNIDLNKLSIRDIISKCILIRYVGDRGCYLTHKIKDIDENGEILSQSKNQVKIDNIIDAQKFMESIGYKVLFKIYDKSYIYLNDKTELAVQCVNDKYILIEFESKSEVLNKEYKSIKEMTEELFSYNLPINKDNLFVKKAELILEEILKNKI